MLETRRTLSTEMTPTPFTMYRVSVSTFGLATHIIRRRLLSILVSGARARQIINEATYHRSRILNDNERRKVREPGPSYAVEPTANASGPTVARTSPSPKRSIMRTVSTAVGRFVSAEILNHRTRPDAIEMQRCWFHLGYPNRLLVRIFRSLWGLFYC